MGSTSKSKNKSGGKTKTYRRHRAGTEIAENAILNGNEIETEPFYREME